MGRCVNGVALLVSSIGLPYVFFSSSSLPHCTVQYTNTQLIDIQNVVCRSSAQIGALEYLEPGWLVSDLDYSVIFHYCSAAQNTYLGLQCSSVIFSNTVNCIQNFKYHSAVQCSLFSSEQFNMMNCCLLLRAGLISVSRQTLKTKNCNIKKTS